VLGDHDVPREREDRFRAAISCLHLWLINMNEQSEIVASDPSSAGSPQVAEARQRRKRRAALLSIVSNSGLVAGKLVVGFLTGSVSVLSEAVHSATDLVAALIAFFSVRASDTPPDAEHPYGHGKIEGISGLAEALLIFAAAAYIIYEALAKLLIRHEPHQSLDAGIAIMAVSAVTNFLIARHLKRVARETDSLALEADAEHLQTDVYTSAAVFVGLALARFTGLSWLDPVAGLCVALVILHTAYRLTRHSMKPLLDARLPIEEEERIRTILNSDSRVLGYHKLRTRKSGSQRHADVHVLIDDDSTLVEAHDLSEELEDGVRTSLPDIHINIHIEPYHAEMRHQQEAHGLSREQANPKSVETGAAQQPSEKRER
jgi:cation diffusion facilitator family transporter